MKKIICSIFAVVMLIVIFAGCNSKKVASNYTFVKPEKYAAIVNVSINPSFDIYLDEKAIVLAIEPKNEDAKKLDFSDVTGLDVKAAMLNLMDKICKNTPLNMESVVLVKLVEGEESIANVDVIEIINNACADAVAKETVNESMKSVLQVRLEDEYGCECIDCNNWYERYWYCYPESTRKWGYEEYEQYMDGWKKGLESLDKNDPMYETAVEQYEAMTYEKFDLKEIKRASHYAQIANMPHEEKNITYKILYGASSNNGYPLNTKEFTPEEYFEKNPEDRELLTGLEKAVNIDVEVYVNGEKQYDYYGGWLYLIEGKWYSNNGLRFSPGG